MNIADVITAGRVDMAADVQSRKRALQRLAQLLADGAPYLTAGEVFSSLVAREKLGSTAIGHGVAIPHARMKGLDESVGAIVRLLNPVDFEAGDGRHVDLIFGIVVPETADREHSELLHSLVDMLAQPDCGARLRRVADGKQLMNLLVELTPTAAD